MNYEAILLGVGTTLLLAGATYIAYMNSVRFTFKSKFYEQRFLQFYLPVFLRIESILYKNISYEEAIEFHEYLAEMIDQHRMLVNDRIIDRARLMRIHLNKNKDYLDDFQSICKHIDSDLDFLQIKLGLPRRGFTYRFNHRQLTLMSFISLHVLREFLVDFLIPPLLLISALLLMTQIHLLKGN